MGKGSKLGGAGHPQCIAPQEKSATAKLRSGFWPVSEQRAASPIAGGLAEAGTDGVDSPQHQQNLQSGIQEHKSPSCFIRGIQPVLQSCAEEAHILSRENSLSATGMPYRQPPLDAELISNKEHTIDAGSDSACLREAESLKAVANHDNGEAREDEAGRESARSLPSQGAQSRQNHRATAASKKTSKGGTSTAPQDSSAQSDAEDDPSVTACIVRRSKRQKANKAGQKAKPAGWRAGKLAGVHALDQGKAKRSQDAASKPQHHKPADAVGLSESTFSAEPALEGQKGQDEPATDTGEGHQSEEAQPAQQSHRRSTRSQCSEPLIQLPRLKPRSHRPSKKLKLPPVKEASQLEARNAENPSDDSARRRGQDHGNAAASDELPSATGRSESPLQDLMHTLRSPFEAAANLRAFPSEEVSAGCDSDDSNSPESPSSQPSLEDAAAAPDWIIASQHMPSETDSECPSPYSDSVDDSLSPGNEHDGRHQADNLQGVLLEARGSRSHDAAVLQTCQARKTQGEILASWQTPLHAPLYIMQFPTY